MLRNCIKKNENRTTTTVSCGTLGEHSRTRVDLRFHEVVVAKANLLTFVSQKKGSECARPPGVFILKLSLGIVWTQKLCL
jgi:hypothetical protein